MILKNKFRSRVEARIEVNKVHNLVKLNLGECLEFLTMFMRQFLYLDILAYNQSNKL